MQFTWNVDPVLVHFWGDVGIRYYGLVFSLVFIGGFFLFRWQVTRAGGPEDDAYAVILPGALAVIIGARLGHVIFYNLDRALADPWWVFQVWKGGLASHGATIGLLLGLGYYAWRQKQSYLEVLDRFTFSSALGATLVRVGNFFNSEIVGRLTDQTWGVRFPRFDGVPAPLRHPSQIYEALMGVAVLGVLFLVDRWSGREKRPRGVLAATFLTVYFMGRFCVEFFKEYQTLPSSSPLTMGQYLSIPAVIGGLGLLVYSLVRNQPAGWNARTSAPAPKTSPKAKQSKRKKRK
ncbi:MAG: prolipoprotein diacylglyceryl transferase [Pseudomonadota bacterium]